MIKIKRAAMAALGLLLLASPLAAQTTNNFTVQGFAWSDDPRIVNGLQPSDLGQPNGPLQGDAHGGITNFLGTTSTLAAAGNDPRIVGAAQTTSVRPADKTVFLGGTSANYCAGMSNASALSQTLAMGSIGLYQHANGNSVCTGPQLTAIWSTWGLTGVTSTGQGQTVAEISESATYSGGYLAFFGGAFPNEASLNANAASGTYTAVTGDAFPGRVYSGFVTPSDLTARNVAITAAHASGAKSMSYFDLSNSPIGTSTVTGVDMDDPFSTGPYSANVRAAALFAGGISLDSPPSFWAQSGAIYKLFMVQMIQWGVANHLRVNVTVSPYALKADASGNTGPCGFDPAFMENTQALASFLKTHNALPSQWTVESYEAPGGAGCTGPLIGNDIATDTTAESLNAAALFLARAFPTAAPGTALAGGTGLPDAGQMAPTTTVPTILPSLSNARVGPLRGADILGLGSAAFSDTNNFNMTGGSIVGPVVLTMTTTIPLFESGILVQGPGGAALISEPNTNEVAFSNTVAGNTAVSATGGFTGPAGVAATNPDGLTVNGHGSLTLSSTFAGSGLSFMWNLSNAQGEGDVLMGKASGAATGGINFLSVDPTTHLATQVASLSQTGVWTATAGTGAGTLAGWSDPRIVGAAPTVSPALTGTPTAPTAAALTNTTQLATTAFDTAAVAAEASARTTAIGVETTRATTAEALKAPIASPTFTGTVAATTITSTNLALNTALSTTATGTTITDALALTTQLVVIRTCASGTGVKLQGLTARGVFYMIRNRSGNSCNVYPDGATHTIEALAAGAPYVMANGEDDDFFTDNTTNWTK